MSKQAGRLQTTLRKVTFYALVILIPFSIFLVLAELTARWLAPLQAVPAPPPLMTIDPYQPNPYIVKMRPYLYIHIPGSTYIQARSDYRVRYEINSQGFRGPEIPQKPEGMKRLLVIGDSVVEGHGNEFDQTFPYLLGKNLQDSGWEVINGGVQGASLIYFSANMDRYLSLQPDAVLIVIHENDIFDDRIREAEYFELPFLDVPARLLRRSGLVEFLSASRFYMTACREWQKRVKTPVDQIVAGNRATWTPHQDQLGLFRVSPDSMPASFVEQQWQMSQPYLDYIVATFREQQTQIVVTNLNTNAIRPDSPYQAHARHLDEQISTWAEERSVPFLSLLPAMSRVYAEKPVSEIIIEGDGHPTAKAHAILAAELHPWLWQHLNEQH